MVDHQKKKEWSDYCFLIGGALILIVAIWIIGGLFATPEDNTPDPPVTTMPYTLINLDYIKDGNLTGFTMVDIRSNVSFNISHIGGAVNIPYGCGSCVKRDTRLYLNETDTIVLYGLFYKCERTATIMDSIGYHDLYILEGWEAWVDTIDG